MGADVFVFAVQTCTDHDAYDPLDVAQRGFYVVPAAATRGSGYKSVGNEFVRTHATAGPIAYVELAAAIEAAGCASVVPGWLGGALRVPAA
jgi:hypothetical protein